MLVRRFLPALLFFVFPFWVAVADSQVPWIQPGVYSAQYQCRPPYSWGEIRPPKAKPPIPIEFYVLDKLVPLEQPNSIPRQGVRVEVDGGQFLATVALRSLRNREFFHFILEYKEREPKGGWGSAPDDIWFDGRPERMIGRAQTDVVCLITPSDNGNTKTLALMSFPPEPESLLTVAIRKYQLPPDAQRVTPPADEVAAYSVAARQALIDDSESWRIDRLLPDTVKAAAFFQVVTEPAIIYAIMDYKSDSAGYASNSETMVKLIDGKVSCILLDKTCRQGRKSFSAITAGLPRLGAMTISSSCFTQRSIPVPRERQRAVGRNSDGSIELETETFFVTGSETVYTCPSQSFELICRGNTIDRIFNSGPSAKKTIELVRDRATDLDARQIEALNGHVRDGTCVRVR